jgi:tripartite-type tricarboxylate transporter receptor subunit TctC
MNMLTVMRSAALACAVLLTNAGVAQQYPSRPVKIIVSIPPGGAPDISARLIGQYLSEILGQPFVIENRPGSNGNIATDLVAKSPPDGHTLLLGADSAITINPHLYEKLPFNVLKDLIPVATLASNQFILAVNQTVPVKTLPEFVEFARKANPPLAYASGGNGSQHQLAMEMLKQRAGLNMVHVPYRGGGPASVATIAGETSVLFAGASSAPQFKAGSLRPLASSGPKRSPRFPDIPSIAEFYPGYEVTIWLGLFAPASTPEPVINRLRTEIAKVLARADFAEKLNVSGSLEPLSTTPDQFADLIRRDYEKYGKIVKDVGAKVD